MLALLFVVSVHTAVFEGGNTTAFSSMSLLQACGSQSGETGAKNAQNKKQALLDALILMLQSGALDHEWRTMK